jgi:hypothetical protein
MAIIKKTEVLVRIWGKGNPCTLLEGMSSSTTSMENTVKVPSKLKI